MRGIVKYKDGKDGWECRELPRTEPAKNEVEIKVKAIGICGSELHLYHDNHFYTPPVVVGHEFSGVIARVGEGVTDYRVGDRVVAQMDKGACGKCEYCRRGMPNFCPHGKAVGYDIDGGWAEYYCTPENLLFKLPDTVSFEAATMAEPCNVICQALIVKQTVKPGDVVLVQGCGTIGVLAAMVAKAIGAGKVLITGTDVDEPVRIPICNKIEAIDQTVNVMRQDLAEEVRTQTGGKGADVVIEASGAEAAINSMFDVLKKTGNVVILGEAAKDKIAVDWNKILLKSCTVYFSFGEVYDAWDSAVKLIQGGKLELEKLITHTLPLEEFRKGFALLEKKAAMKVILKP